MIQIAVEISPTNASGAYRANWPASVPSVAGRTITLSVVTRRGHHIAAHVNSIFESIIAGRDRGVKLVKQLKPKQIKRVFYLSEEQDRLLRHLAVERKTTFSALMQEAAEKLLAQAKERGEFQFGNNRPPAVDR